MGVVVVICCEVSEVYSFGLITDNLCSYILFLYPGFLQLGVPGGIGAKFEIHCARELSFSNHGLQGLNGGRNVHILSVQVLQSEVDGFVSLRV